MQRSDTFYPEWLRYIILILFLFNTGFVADVVYSGEAAIYTKPAPVPVKIYSKPAPPPTYTYKKAAPSTITYTKSAAPSVTYTKSTPSKVDLALITDFIARFRITTFTIFCLQAKLITLFF